MDSVDWNGGMDWIGMEWPDERGTIVGLLRSSAFTIAIGKLAKELSVYCTQYSLRYLA